MVVGAAGVASCIALDFTTNLPIRLAWLYPIKQAFMLIFVTCHLLPTTCLSHPCTFFLAQNAWFSFIVREEDVKRGNICPGKSA